MTKGLIILPFCPIFNSNSPKFCKCPKVENSINYSKNTYTYFKKRCRRERRMAVVERKLHDRKELWFPYLVCKNNEFFAWRLTRELKQPRRRRQQKPHKFAYLIWKTVFLPALDVHFHLLTFWRRSRSFYDVKWPFLQLCGRRTHMVTNVQFCLVASAGFNLIPG